MFVIFKVCWRRREEYTLNVIWNVNTSTAGSNYFVFYFRSACSHSILKVIAVTLNFRVRPQCEERTNNCFGLPSATESAFLYHKIPQKYRPQYQWNDCSMSRVRYNDFLINYSRSASAITQLALLQGAGGSPTVCPKGWSAYLLPAAVWRQGHQAEAAFSPSPRLGANAVPLNPIQREEGGGGAVIREQGSMIFMVEVPWVMWFISHTPPLLPFVNKALSQPM